MKTLLPFVLVLVSLTSRADNTRYHFFVQFHDKELNYVNFDEPETYLSQRCIDRRKRLNIPIDSLDLPVTASYVENIKKPSIQVRYVSKWLNGAVISTSSKDTAYRLKIKFYVDDVVYLGKTVEKTNKTGRQSLSNDLSLTKEHYGDGYKQLEMLNGPQLHNQGYKGNGVLIAVFDAGFKRLNGLSLFRHLAENNRLVYTYDVVDLESDVYDDDDHGLHVMGCMAAYQKSKMIGSAPEASYALFRTEAAQYENWLEELNWVRAAEMADSMGVDIINSSLGYNTFDEDVLNHRHEDLDGKTTFISRGASTAGDKGILVVNSAGNDGNKDWGKLDFPADVENILVVGAVDMNLEVPAFSSPGPTADFRIKPDIAALGRRTTIATTYGVGTGNGTSYSCPIVAGLMACLWEANPQLTAERLRLIAIQSAHMSLEPDNAAGHGLPDFNLALVMTGKHSDFNYANSSVIGLTEPAYNTTEIVTLYTPNQKHVQARLNLPKRFLFFRYKKTKWLDEKEVGPEGFTKFMLPLYNIPSGKSVELEFLQRQADGKFETFEVRSGTMR
ncbi:MAG: S8 family serine peptidase [Bacteroidia bacterium]|nr:S8 family serine peptidase [Bacteroidia bacterium]